MTALSTSFQFGGCASTVSRQDSGPSATFVDFSACWSFCANYIYAIIDPDAIVFYRCYCANTPPIIVSSNICGSNYFMYSHSAAQAASGIARRSRRDEAEARQRLLAAHKDCPVGYDACLLSDDPNDDSYECLKTHSELGTYHAWRRYIPILTVTQSHAVAASMGITVCRSLALVVSPLSSKVLL